MSAKQRKDFYYKNSLHLVRLCVSINHNSFSKNLLATLPQSMRVSIAFSLRLPSSSSSYLAHAISSSFNPSKELTRRERNVSISALSTSSSKISTKF